MGVLPQEFSIIHLHGCLTALPRPDSQLPRLYSSMLPRYRENCLTHMTDYITSYKGFHSDSTYADRSHRIVFSQLASLLYDHLKNLVISVKLDHLQILQLPLPICRMVHCWRQLNLLMCACEVGHDSFCN